MSECKHSFYNSVYIVITQGEESLIYILIVVNKIKFTSFASSFPGKYLYTFPALEK